MQTARRSAPAPRMPMPPPAGTPGLARRTFPLTIQPCAPRRIGYALLHRTRSGTAREPRRNGYGLSWQACLRWAAGTQKQVRPAALGSFQEPSGTQKRVRPKIFFRIGFGRWQRFSGPHSSYISTKPGQADDAETGTANVATQQPSEALRLPAPLAETGTPTGTGAPLNATQKRVRQRHARRVATRPSFGIHDLSAQKQVRRVAPRVSRVYVECEC